MKKVLVMGGSYFIGKKLVDILLDNNYEVYILNRGTRPIDNPKINQLICDRNDSEKMKTVLNNYIFDIVIDICGLNKNQAEILCDSLTLKSIQKFVFLSSSAVYDVENLSIPYNENDKLHENKHWTFYGKDKIEAESYYTSRLSNTSADLIILRPPYVYGENNYAQRESFIFEHICNDKPILVPISNCKLQFIYTADLANIIIKLINEANQKVSIYNVGNSSYVTAKEWIQACENAANKKARVIEYDYQKFNRKAREFFPFFDYDNVLDVEKIKSIISEETSFEEGLKIAYDWYLVNKDKIKFKESISKNEEEILKELDIK